MLPGSPAKDHTQAHRQAKASPGEGWGFRVFLQSLKAENLYRSKVVGKFLILTHSSPLLRIRATAGFFKRGAHVLCPASFLGRFLENMTCLSIFFYPSLQLFALSQYVLGVLIPITPSFCFTFYILVTFTPFLSLESSITLPSCQMQELFIPLSPTR